MQHVVGRLGPPDTVVFNVGTRPNQEAWNPRLPRRGKKGGNMQSVIPLLAGLNAGVAMLLILLAIVYGLFGWRVVRYLSVVDAVGIAILLAIALKSIEDRAATALPWVVGAGVCLIALPYLAWRFSHCAVILMCGATGFLVVQIPLFGSQSPGSVVLLLGLVGAGLAIAMGLSMSREAAVVLTGLHGGAFIIGALAVLSSEHGSLAGRLFDLLATGHAAVLPAVALCLSIILITLQWADLQREVDPFSSLW